MVSRLIQLSLDWIRKQIFLQSVITRLFPWMCSPLAKYSTGLLLRYLYYKASHAIQAGFFERYCDLSHMEYISLRTIMICEYRSYVEMGLIWCLDFINQILKEDGVMESIAELRAEMKASIAELRGDIGDLRTELRGDILPTLLTPADLMHEK
jgi:hypothetical protein